MSIVFNKKTSIHYVYKRDKAKLRILLHKYNSGDKIYHQINKILMFSKRTIMDKEIYTTLRKRGYKNLTVFTVNRNNPMKVNLMRADKRWKDIKYIMRQANGPKPKSYLGIGIGDGMNTKVIGENTVSLKNTYGIDVEDERHKSLKKTNPFKFSKYDGISIPYCGVDFVTMFMVFHHVQKPDAFLKSLHVSLNPGSLLILREHDGSDNITRSLIHIQHEIMDQLYNKDSVYTNTDTNYYKKLYNRNELINKFESSGFTYLNKINYEKMFNPKYNPTKYIYLAFKRN